MRSWLFVPGNRESMIEKALASSADVVIIDLEDSVAPGEKTQARSVTAKILEQRDRKRPVYVRVNPLESGMIQEDLDAVIPHSPDGLMQPKTETGMDVEKLAELAGSKTPIIAIATETAASLFGLGTYGNLKANLCAMTWGAEDLSNSLGAVSAKDEQGHLSDPYRLARSLCLAGARAADVEPIDSVYVDFRDSAGLEKECHAAVRDGFTGKMAIHPSQVDTINRVFTPSPEMVTEATAIVEAFEAKPGAGVLAIDGKMYDIPHLKRARKILQRAEQITNRPAPKI